MTAETKGLSGAKIALIAVGVLFTIFIMTGVGLYKFAVNEVYNPFQMANLKADAQWAEVVNQYQRRSDLIPNLVAIVSQAAGHENSTLKDVIEARSKANSVQLTADALKDPEAMKRFSQAQGDLTTALSKLMMLTENYPNLKVNENFLTAQTELVGTENRITVARNRYIASVVQVNEVITPFLSHVAAGFMGLKERPQYTVDNEKAISVAPKIETYKKGQ